MILLEQTVLWGIAGLVVISLLMALRKPLTRLLALLFRSALGLGALAIGQAAGLSLGVNLCNALLLGILGVPGFGLLLLLQWIL